MCTYYCSSLLLRDLQKASFFSRVANSVHLKRGRPHRLVMVNRRSWQPFGDGQTPAAEGLCYIPVSVQLYKYRRREGHRVTSANSPARASRPCLRTSKQSLFYPQQRYEQRRSKSPNGATFDKISTPPPPPRRSPPRFFIIFAPQVGPPGRMATEVSNATVAWLWQVSQEKEHARASTVVVDPHERRLTTYIVFFVKRWW